MKEIRNKKVLVICRESFSFPMFFLAQKLLEQNNDVSVFFIHPEESYYDKCLYNENTYYNFKENLTKVTLFDLKQFCDSFNKKPEINYDYLEALEKDYTYFKNLNLQLTVSQLTTRHYHNRFYFKYSNFEQNLTFLELGYRYVIDVIDKCQPDLILDTEDAELLRTILLEVSIKQNIPYITIDYPRYDFYKIPSFCLGVKTDDFVKLKYNEFYLRKKADLLNEYSYILNIRNNISNIMPQEFKGTTTSQYKADSLFVEFKKLYGIAFYFLNLLFTNGLHKSLFNNQILYSNPIKHFLFYVKVAIKKQILFRSNSFFNIPSKSDKYVYMPLHLIPESTTFVKAPFFINELFIIEQVSKSLPIGWKLYVKEHQSMVGERSFSFYRRIKKIPNVRLVKFNYYDDPKPWIEKSMGVITITGTGAYEAALLGKKAIIFGDVPYSLIEGITIVKSFEDLPKLIASFGQTDNIHSCAAYLAAIKSIGTKINLKEIISESESIIRNNKVYTKEFDDKIKSLLLFYTNAYYLVKNYD
jgi:hypothetical protein